jgi:hypothetical protein
MTQYPGPGEAILTGKRIRLRPVEQLDYPHLRRAELSEQLAFRWRHRGVHLPPESFAQSLWSGAFLNFIVESLVDSQPIAVISAYSLATDSSFCYVGAARFAASSAVASPTVGGIGLAFQYLFKGWPLRKIYLETPDYNLHQFDGAMGWLLREEGRLVEHEYHDGRYWDHVTLALWRSDWESTGHQIMRWA